jgi:hypothetical protein
LFGKCRTLERVQHRRRQVGVCLLAVFGCACSFNADTLEASNGIDPIPDSGSASDSDADTDDGRVGTDVIALYKFDTQIVGEIADVSGFGAPLNLAVVGNGNYTVTSEGWNLTGDTTISSKAPALKLALECSQSNAITIEVWIRPASVAQTGPARILGMSLDPYSANFVLAQGANNGNPDDRFNVRLLSEDSGDQMVSAVTRRGVVTTDWTHLVFARGADGSSSFYVNGEVTGLNSGGGAATFPGTLSNWDSSYTLNLGNELESTGLSRFWHGEYALLAIYRRDLSGEEVTQNFLAGY